jgi:flagellar biosynthesis/type III secretory pathway M-ring protein FliF/YscJ
VVKLLLFLLAILVAIVVVVALVLVVVRRRRAGGQAGGRSARQAVKQNGGQSAERAEPERVHEPRHDLANAAYRSDRQRYEQTRKFSPRYPARFMGRVRPPGEPVDAQPADGE